MNVRDDICSTVARSASLTVMSRTTPTFNAARQCAHVRDIRDTGDDSDLHVANGNPDASKSSVSLCWVTLPLTDVPSIVPQRAAVLATLSERPHAERGQHIRTFCER